MQPSTAVPGTGLPGSSILDEIGISATYALTFPPPTTAAKPTPAITSGPPYTALTLPPSTEGTTAAELTSAITNTSYAAVSTDDWITAAVIGGVIAVVLLALIILVVVVLRYMSRQKGSYLTNEMDDDEESVDSQRALQGGTDVEIVEEK